MISTSISSTPLNTSNLTINSNGIDKKHLEEWLNSGVDEKIISKNVRSIHDAREVDKVLDRNTKKRWKHSHDLVPCWQVSGLDPFTSERTLLGTQVKPDTLIFTKDGKPQKYLGASGYGTYPLFLDNGIEGYWQSIVDDKSQPVIITEGAKKAGAGLSLGYATISIPGVSTCKKKGRLHSWLNTLAGFGRTFYFCFDNDIVHKRPVQDGMLSMARELCATGAKVMVIELPSGSLKGMDDFISNNDPEQFKDLIDNAKTIEEWRSVLEELWQQNRSEERESKMSKYIDIVKAGWGDSLRMNLLKRSIELHGQPLDINKVRLRIALEFDVDVPIGDSQMIVEMIAEENSYHPVNEYFDNLAEQYPDVGTDILDNLATRYFGTEDPLHNIYMKKTLVAAVARAKRPGCKHDTATILVGKQGAYKSTFWKELYGEDWFCDELGDASERDELMKLHRFWCLEWSEFESVYKRKDVSALKKFMSSRVDAFRSPYDRNVKEHPRRSVLVGTTNDQEILSDPTGSRRFWIIPVQGIIPIKLVAQERDLLWAAANALYESGYQWWLTPDESSQQKELNQNFETVDPWTEAIEKYVTNREFVTVVEIFNMLSIEPARQDMQSTKRITAILRRLNWQAGRRQITGVLQRGWIFDQSEKNKLWVLPGSPGSPGSPGNNFEAVSVDTATNTAIFTENINVIEKQGDFRVEQECLSQQALSAKKSWGDPGDPGDPLENQSLFFEEVQLLQHDELQQCDSELVQSDVVRKCGNSPEHPTKNPDDVGFEIGAVYWSESVQKRVKIVKLFKTLPEADVCVSGEIEIVRVKLSDLTLVLSPPSPSPQANALAVGDRVTPLEGKHKKDVLTVTVIDNAGIWAKKTSRGFTPPIGPFQPHQLKKHIGGG